MIFCGYFYNLIRTDTCVLLHPPGFELDDGVGIVAAVLSLAAVPDALAAQIQLALDAQWADLSVVHTGGPHYKCQTLIGIKGVAGIQVRADCVIVSAALADDPRFTVIAFLTEEHEHALMFLYKAYDTVYWVQFDFCRFKQQLSVQRPLSLFCPNINLELVEGKVAFLSILTEAQIPRLQQLSAKYKWSSEGRPGRKRSHSGPL